MKEPFERVVQRHGATVLRVCRAVVGPHDADDAWSETFLAALRAWPDLPDDANVEAWLVTIAHRKAIDQVRAASRRAVPLAELPAAPVPDATEARVRDLDLWAAVAVLPERQRHAVALHHLGGLAHAEVAALLGGTAAAARRASADGIATLRRTSPRWAAASASLSDAPPAPRSEGGRA
ncbi:RNA polymerase sigma factor [Cellulomonas gilvus]|uniref:RNA polymerase sigma factor n=1 Tax=Cellulomonas gilvus TaxID=11 RepID=UPI00059F1AFF|nr:sigma-70 family RNA polymerase sigma factor [Cellulomonas gilvus]